MSAIIGMPNLPETRKLPQCLPVRGLVGYYRPDPGSKRSPNIVLDVEADKVRVFEIRTQVEFSISLSDWMSQAEMEAETAALPANPRYALGGLMADMLDQMLKDRKQVMTVADATIPRAAELLAQNPIERKVPETQIPLAVIKGQSC